MGLSDKIEVATIAINKTTIFEITVEDCIAIPITFDKH